MSLMMWTRTAGDYSPVMDTGLAGKRVLVTGASGGIGSACARAFAAEGARVVVHYNTSRERAEAIAAELDGAIAVGADLTDEAQVEHLFEEARERLGGVDVCVAIAGRLAARRRGGVAAFARALGGDAAREPDGDVPDGARTSCARSSATAPATSC